MNLAPTMKWVALALVGLAIAVGVAIAAANLTSQQIGIASESVSAGDALAPSLHVPGETPGRGGNQEAPSKEGTTTLPAEPPATTTEEEPPFEEPVPPSSEGRSDESGGSEKDGDD
ncbi:MAG: hypothetical protein ACTHKT_09320 [Solirubrobacterales bacterium]